MSITSHAFYVLNWLYNVHYVRQCTYYICLVHKAIDLYRIQRKSEREKEMTMIMTTLTRSNKKSYAKAHTHTHKRMHKHTHARALAYTLTLKGNGRRFQTNNNNKCRLEICTLQWASDFSKVLSCKLKYIKIIIVNRN